MSFSQDMASFVERFVEIDPADKAAIKALQNEALARLASRSSRPMSELQAAANEARRDAARRHAEIVYPKIKQARAEGYSSLRTIGKWLLDHDIRPQQAETWNLEVIRRIEMAGDATAVAVEKVAVP